MRAGSRCTHRQTPDTCPCAAGPSAGQAWRTRPIRATVTRFIGLGLLAAFGFQPPLATSAAVPHIDRHANFEQESASRDARSVADWVVDSGDSRGMPFAIVDKKDARVFVFDADGRLRGAAPALLGLAVGDDAVPGIGERALSTIRPEERTTPAGRFVAALDRNLHGKEILWVDYDGAISMHPVVTAKPAERRLQRLTSATPLDNRISYGCINVPAKFFDTIVHPAFSGTNGVVYVLPETRSAQETFASYDVDLRAQARATLQDAPAASLAVPPAPTLARSR